MPQPGAKLMTKPGEGMRDEAGIPPDHYLGRGYNSKERFISYWHQIDEVLKHEAQCLLEIGVGNHFLADFVRRLGKRIITADINPALLPEVVGSIGALPFADQSFDLVIACEVLEHLPLASLKPAMQELHRVTSRWVVLSLPNAIRANWLQMSVPRFGILRCKREFPWLPRWPKIPDHYWEIGHAGVSERSLVEIFGQTGFTVEASYRVLENPYHHFFVLARNLEQ